MGNESNGWNEWSRHVLAELKRFNLMINELDSKLNKMEVENTKEITALKVKAGLWGAIGASIPAAIAIIYTMMSK